MRPNWFNVKFFLLAGLLLFQISCKDSCSTSNPFRKYLESKHKVEILSVPDKTQKSCGDEWKTYGTCCKQKSLQKATSEDASAIKNAVDLFVTKYSSFATAFKSYYDNFRKILVSDEKEWILKQKLSQVKVIQENKKLLNNLTFLKLVYDIHVLSDTKMLQTYKQEMETCWNFNIQLRAAAVCSACSSRGSIFFDGKKAKAHMEVCTQIIEKCYEAHLKTVFFLTYLYKMNLFEMALEKAELKVKVRDVLDDFRDEFRDFMKDGEAESMSKFKDYKQKLLSGAVPKEKFCDKFVKLSDKPFITEFVNNIEKDNTFKVIVGKNAQDILEVNSALLSTKIKELDNTIKTKLGINTPSRVLNMKFSRELSSSSSTLSAGNDFFTTDASFIEPTPVDSIANSVFQTPASDPSTCMNLNLIYP